MTHFEISDDELSTEILHDEIERLRAVLDKTASDLSDEIARSLKAEAAIARVRELCAREDAESALAVMTQRYKSTQAERDCEYEDRKAAEAELADLERALDGDEYVQRMRTAEAALARVRELCEGWPSWREVTAAEVLRTLDGAE